METDSNFLAIGLISLIAAISPGPDFFIVFRNSLVYSRKSGILTACGVSAAIIIHLAYTLIGIGILIAESPLIYTLIKFLGVVYLFYIGLKSLLSSFKNTESVLKSYDKALEQPSAFSVFMQGFWTNLLNPKAAVFFISLFSQFIDVGTPVLVRIEYGLITCFIVLGWFCFLACMLTIPRIVEKLDRYRVYIDRMMGCTLMILGLKILFV